jgi:hypothetical protein
MSTKKQRMGHSELQHRFFSNIRTGMKRRHVVRGAADFCERRLELPYKGKTVLDF